MVGEFNDYWFVSFSFQFVRYFNILRSNRNFKRFCQLQNYLLCRTVCAGTPCISREFFLVYCTSRSCSSYSSYISSCCSLIRFLAAASWYSASEHCFVIFVSEVLRASFCKYRESGDTFKIFNFLIFCPNKAFSELFSKIQLKDPKALEFFQNRGKFENRHFGLPRPLKIDKNDAFSFRSCW